MHERAKWKNFDEVKYCSDKCRKNKPAAHPLFSTPESAGEKKEEDGLFKQYGNTNIVITCYFSLLAKRWLVNTAEDCSLIIDSQVDLFLCLNQNYDKTTRNSGNRAAQRWLDGAERWDKDMSNS
jgi:hypothetical protein